MHYYSLECFSQLCFVHVREAATVSISLFIYCLTATIGMARHYVITYLILPYNLLPEQSDERVVVRLSNNFYPIQIIFKILNA